MSFSTEIKKMTIEEKLRMMELLWDELREDAESTEFPKWHQDTLDLREKAVRKGHSQYTDWKKAKSDIQQSVE